MRLSLRFRVDRYSRRVLEVFETACRLSVTFVYPFTSTFLRRRSKLSGSGSNAMTFPARPTPPAHEAFSRRQHQVTILGECGIE